MLGFVVRVMPAVRGASDVAETSREGTFGFTARTVTPHDEAAVGVVNSACAVMTAEVGVALDIAGGCAGLGTYQLPTDLQTSILFA